MERNLKTIAVNITVSRTVQIKQYEPLTISITENHEIESKDSKDFREKEKKLTRALSKTINKLVLDQAEDLRD